MAPAGEAAPVPRVVVVGAGFAGLAAVHALTGTGADVTVVDRHMYSTFQPLLYQVATGGLNPGDVTYPVRRSVRSRSASFRRGTVTTVKGSQVVLEDGDRLDFDYLIVAAGVTTNHFGIAGAQEHSMALYTRREAVALRDQLMAALEGLAAGSSDEITALIVGGGATGVETAGALAELRNSGIKADFPEIDRRSVHIVLVEQGPELLAPFHPKLRRYALSQLRGRGVDVRLHTAIHELTERSATMGNGVTIRADLTIWAAGVAASSAVGDWGLPQGRGGRIMVDEDLRVMGQDRVFAVGDLALSDSARVPQQAQPAIQMGGHAARQIARLLQGQPTEGFVYHDKGSMATIGRSAAVVELPHGVRLTGLLAWLAWVALHIVMLLGNRNRLSALLNLTWRYLAWPSGSGIVVGDIPGQD